MCPWIDVLSMGALTQGDVESEIGLTKFRTAHIYILLLTHTHTHDTHTRDKHTSRHRRRLQGPGFLVKDSTKIMNHEHRLHCVQF